MIILVRSGSALFIDLDADLHELAPLQLRRLYDLDGDRQLTPLLEPYLGFLHTIQYGKPSLVCDLQELYRHLIDDFVIGQCQGLNTKDFVSKDENVSRSRKGKRRYLKDSQMRCMMRDLDEFFLSRVEIPSMRSEKSQAIDTLINEEALLLAKYLRNEKSVWIPRIVGVS